MRLSEKPRVKMHHGMGVSTGDRRGNPNSAMQSRNGICDKIENYISDLGQWAVWRAIIMGQFLSLVLCLMTLVNHHINTTYQITIPTGQNLPHYAMMCLVYTTWMSCRGSGNGLFSVMRARGWRYLLIALIDVEACTLITSSHRFTSLVSIQLLDCVAIPVALALSCLVLGVRYRMVHIVGVSICLMGVGCLVWAGIEDNKDPTYTGKNQLVGDMLCLSGAVLFSVTTVLQELAVKTVDIIEYLGMLGFFGTILSCIQVAVLERVQIENFHWNNIPVITFSVVYCITQFVFFSLVPVILFESGATALQLALLTADSFNTLTGMILHQYKFHVLYFVSYALIMTGIYIYAVKRTPMTSGTTRRQHNEHLVPDYRYKLEMMCTIERLDYHTFNTRTLNEDITPLPIASVNPCNKRVQRKNYFQLCSTVERTAPELKMTYFMGSLENNTMGNQRHISHPDITGVEMATSSGVSGLSGTLDMRASMLGGGRETLDASSLPLSVSSETAFTSFYGSQANLKASRSSMPRISSNSHLNASGGMSSIRMT